jgi:hypothetical protein
MNKKWMLLTGVFSILLAIAPGVCMAEEEKGHEEHFGPHRLELFLGNTHDEGENDFTIGIGYEYRINQMFGIGVLFEGIRSESREWIIFVPLILHPYKGWRFVLAPGLELEEQTRDKEYLTRVGAGYEFEIGRWSITPEFNLDFADRGAVPVFGVSFGYAF